MSFGRGLLLVSMSICFLAGLFILGCEDDESVTSPADLEVSGCIGCHASQEKLVATADPVDEPPPSSGEG